MLSLTINSVEKISSVDYDSLNIDNVLNDKIDKCSFIIKSHSNNSYTPNVGREVVITHNGTKIFGGVIVNVETKQITQDLVFHTIQCTDYARLLSKRLVPDSFTSQTADAIIASLMTTYAPAGFTTNNVDAPITVDYVGFNYKPLDKCLDELAELLNYDWYVDYDKDIHFFAKETVNASIDITDTGGVYNKGSLKIRRDNSQVRNTIIVRGGEYLGAVFTTEIDCNGVDFIYPLPYKYSDFKTTLTGNILNHGVDYINDADNYDVLYNFNEKILRFKEADKPSATATLRVSGKPHLPVIVKLKSQVNIDAMVSMEGSDGKYEYLVIDKSINSKEGARQRAEAEINAYAQTLKEGEFTTETDGLKAGQRILINSTSLGINEYFIINKVKIQQFTVDSLIYHISLITTRTMDLISVLQKLLLAETKKLEIKANEIIDLVESYPDEKMTMSETVTSSILHNPQTEAMSLGEVFTAQSIDYDIKFVVGPYTPSGTKRVFIIDGSRIG